MKKLKILLFLLLTSLLTENTFASSIDKVEAINNNTVQITASNDVVFPNGSVDGDIKVLKDINVSFNQIDKTNGKKILLNLSDDLKPNNSYSLITILGGNGNIDFEIGDYVEGEITNQLLQSDEEGIEKINIIDSRTVELYYNYDLKDDSFEYKILNDVSTNGLFSEGNNILNLKIDGSLENSSDYVLMILDLYDESSNELVLDEDLYSFTTSSDLVKNVEKEEIILNSAEEVQDKNINGNGNIVNVALSAKEMPDTGSTVGILIFLTIILNGLFFFRKKLIK